MQALRIEVLRHARLRVADSFIEADCFRVAGEDVQLHLHGAGGLEPGFDLRHKLPRQPAPPPLGSYVQGYEISGAVLQLRETEACQLTLRIGQLALRFGQLTLRFGQHGDRAGGLGEAAHGPAAELEDWSKADEVERVHRLPVAQPIAAQRRVGRAVPGLGVVRSYG